MVRCESRPSTISPINLGMKQTGAPSAGNPHAGCDVAGAGNGFTVWLMRHSQRKRGETDRPDLRNTAPVLDPTGKCSPILMRKTIERAPTAQSAFPAPTILESRLCDNYASIENLIAEVASDSCSRYSCATAGRVGSSETHFVVFMCSTLRNSSKGEAAG
jgi:hypothetical protein